MTPAGTIAEGDRMLLRSRVTRDCLPRFTSSLRSGMSRSSSDHAALNRRPAAVAAAIVLTALAALLEPLASGRTEAGATIVDGDTISIAGERIRILGIDAPESFRSRCENELVLGLKAKERLRDLLDPWTSIRIERNGHDRYGRTLAHVFAGGVNVGDTLLREGYALPYKPGPDAKLARLRTWCGPSAELGDTWRAGS